MWILVDERNQVWMALVSTLMLVACDSGSDRGSSAQKGGGGTTGSTGGGGASSGGTTPAEAASTGSGAASATGGSNSGDTGAGGGADGSAADGGVAADGAGCATDPCSQCCCKAAEGCTSNTCKEQVVCMQNCVTAAGDYNAKIDAQCRAACGSSGSLDSSASALWDCMRGQCHLTCLGM